MSPGAARGDSLANCQRRICGRVSAAHLDRWCEEGQTSTRSMVSVTVNNSVASLSVASVTYSTYGGRWSNRRLDLRVAVVDGSGHPVSGATVIVTIDRNTSEYAQLTTATDASEIALFSLRDAPAGQYTEVGTVSHANLGWDGLWPAAQPNDPFVK